MGGGMFRKEGMMLFYLKWKHFLKSPIDCKDQSSAPCRHRPPEAGVATQAYGLYSMLTYELNCSDDDI